MHQKKFKPLNFEKHPQKAISHLSVHWVGSWRMGDWQSHCYRLKVSQLYQFTSKQRSQYCQSKTLSNFFFLLGTINPHESYEYFSFHQSIHVLKLLCFLHVTIQLIIIFILTLCYLSYMVLGPLSLVFIWSQGS